jgi:hypothetical protein
MAVGRGRHYYTVLDCLGRVIGVETITVELGALIYLYSELALTRRRCLFSVRFTALLY